MSDYNNRYRPLPHPQNAEPTTLSVRQLKEIIQTHLRNEGHVVEIGDFKVNGAVVEPALDVIFFTYQPPVA